MSTSASSLSAARTRGIPDATVARLPIYHRVLKSLSDSGITTVSSDELARNCGVTPAKLRKDLSHLGSYGTRGVGYDVAFLSYHISRELGLSTAWGVVIVGLGNLGNALVAHRGFASRGFDVVGIVDTHPDVVGTSIRVGERYLRVSPLSDLEAVVSERHAAIGVIATPGEVAQDVCDRLVASGICSILNFAPVVLSVPDDVEVRKVDLAVELQILAFHEQRRGEEPPATGTAKSPTGYPPPSRGYEEALHA